MCVLRSTRVKHRGPASVLVVDDEPMVREVVAQYLQRDGVGVHEVADGDEALRWLAANRPAWWCST